MYKSNILILLVSILCIHLGFYNPCYAVGEIIKSADKSNFASIAGYAQNKVLLVVPSRQAKLVDIGENFNEAKVVSLGDIDALIEYKGNKIKQTVNPSWQIAPSADITNFIACYLKYLAHKLDSQTVDVDQGGLVRILANGQALTPVFKVKQVEPFWKLPEYLESIDFVVSLKAHEPSEVKLQSMVISQKSYDRLFEPLYKTYTDNKK